MMTRVISITNPKTAPQAVTQAVETIKGGGLVAFPTETVYGLAANAALPATLDRLAQLKQRPDTKPFTLHIGDKSDLSHYVPRISLLNQQLLRKGWPGPMTGVFLLEPQSLQEVKDRFGKELFAALYHEGTIGVRLPDHDVTRAILRQVGSPVVAPSANLAGKRPPNTAQDVLKQLDGQIDLIVDGGSTRYQQASTVVRLFGDGFEILREGILDAGTIQRMRSVSILFVCTGNSCRSPMAEGLCKKILAQKTGCSVDQLTAAGYKVSSAGVMAYEGGQASPEAVAACGGWGVDICYHRARPLTTQILRQSDVIYAMTASHRRSILEMQPEAAARTWLLGDTADVADPIGLGEGVYRDCAKRIETLLQARLAELWNKSRLE